MKAGVEAVRAHDLAALKRLLASDRKSATKPQVVVETASHVWPAGFELLVAAGADPNALWRGYRPLHALIQSDPHHSTAPSKERLAALERFLAAGADPRKTGAWPPARAVLVAAFSGWREAVETLRERSPSDDVFLAAALHDEKAVARLLKRDATLAKARDDGGLTALQCCCASRLDRGDARADAQRLAIARASIEDGADVRARTKSWSHDVDATYFAASAGHAALFELMLEHGADATDALCPALWNATVEFAQICLRHGAKPARAKNGEGVPLLVDLVRWGRMTQALWLLEHGGDPNAADSRGWNAVHQAVSRGNVNVLRAVLEHGGDVHARDAQGLRPLEIAVLTKKTKTLELLAAAMK